jgi:hypothetical protein
MFFDSCANSKLTPAKRDAADFHGGRAKNFTACPIS